jgi:hypothetical protein
MLKKNIKWIGIGSVILLTGFFLLDYKLAPASSYCVNRNRLLANIPYNASASKDYAKTVYNCLSGNILTEDLNKDVLENYAYPLDSKDSWRLELENTYYLSELFGDCSIPKKCVVAKFHIKRGSMVVFNEAYFHYLIFAKDSNGKFVKTNESFGQSGYKG